LLVDKFITDGYSKAAQPHSTNAASQLKTETYVRMHKPTTGARHFHMPLENYFYNTYPIYIYLLTDI